MSLQMIDNRLNQLHNEPVTDEELREADYRRIWRAGFGGAINALNELPPSPERAAIIAQMFRFYLYRLETWQHLPLNRKIPPPEISWAEVTKLPPIELADDAEACTEFLEM